MTHVRCELRSGDEVRIGDLSVRCLWTAGRLVHLLVSGRGMRNVVLVITGGRVQAAAVAPTDGPLPEFLPGGGRALDAPDASQGRQTPVVSLGQGEYRVDIMPEDLLGKPRRAGAAPVSNRQSAMGNPRDDRQFNPG